MDYEDEDKSKYYQDAFDPGYNYYINAIGNKIHIRVEDQYFDE